jgi:hypothetical protein
MKALSAVAVACLAVDDMKGDRPRPGHRKRQIAGEARLQAVRLADRWHANSHLPDLDQNESGVPRQLGADQERDGENDRIEAVG